MDGLAADQSADWDVVAVHQRGCPGGDAVPAQWDHERGVGVELRHSWQVAILTTLSPIEAPHEVLRLLSTLYRLAATTARAREGSES